MKYQCATYALNRLSKASEWIAPTVATITLCFANTDGTAQATRAQHAAHEMPSEPLFSRERLINLTNLFIKLAQAIGLFILVEIRLDDEVSLRIITLKVPSAIKKFK